MSSSPDEEVCANLPDWQVKVESLSPEHETEDELYTATNEQEATLPQAKKRKRTKNTSPEQYVIFLQCMENDYNFRTGIVDSTVGENYVEKKWEELTNTLNAVDNAPRLTGEEWKKRFNDWKYALRSKYRKSIEHHRKIGSRPRTDIKLTSIEERALNIMGNVFTPDSFQTNKYDGSTVHPKKNVVQKPKEGTDTENLATASNDARLVKNPVSQSNVVRNTNGEVATDFINNAGKNDAARSKPVSLLAERLLESSAIGQQNLRDTNETAKQFSQEYIAVKREENRIELLRLKFEIAKYKFENPTFSFDE